MSFRNKTPSDTGFEPVLEGNKPSALTTKLFVLAVGVFRNKVHSLTDCSVSVTDFKTVYEAAESTFGGQGAPLRE